MRKNLFLLLLLTVVHGALFAQSPKKITYLFSKKNFSEPTGLHKSKPGDYYIIEINDINQNLYKVSINHSDTIVSKAIEMPSFGSFPLDALSTLISSIKPISTILVKQQPVGGQKKFRVTTVQMPVPVGEEMEKYKGQLDNYLQELRRIKTEIDNLYLFCSTEFLT